ncbi:MAG: Hsp20/alpha crystallin family protein [bacterium]
MNDGKENRKKPPKFLPGIAGRREGRAFSPEHLGAWQPPTDIFETGEAVMVFVEIPGMDENDIEITFSDNLLVIEGEKKQMMEERGRSCYCIERTFGAFRRVFTLHVPVDKNNISATYYKGMLKIVLPKEK